MTIRFGGRFQPNLGFEPATAGWFVVDRVVRFFDFIRRSLGTDGTGVLKNKKVGDSL
jgi:hypothetical protein